MWAHCDLLMKGLPMSPRLGFIAALYALAVCGCGDANAQPKTVAGPESDKLLQQSVGYVLITRMSREITAIQLPSLQEKVIRPTRPADPNDDPTIYRLSGPDAQGRIAYIEDHFFIPNDKDRRHLLK